MGEQNEAASAAALACQARRRNGHGAAASSQAPDLGSSASGIAETFDEARIAFHAAWQELATTRAEADYEAWRRQRDWTAWKDRMHGLALPLPTQRPEGIARCFCGEVLTNRTIDAHILAAHRLTAA